MSSPEPLEKRPGVQRKLLVLLGVLLLALWSTVLWSNATAEKNGLEAIRRETAALALLFAKHTESTFRNVDHALLQLRDTWVRKPAEFSAEVEAQRRELASSIVQISVIDAKGVVAFSSFGLPDKPVNVADREFFQAHLKEPEDRLLVSRPLRGRITNKWAIQLTRPIYDGKRLRGVMAIAVDPLYFVNFYEAAGLGEGGAARMIRDTGEVMARSSEHDKYIGKVVTPSPYADPGAPLQGSFRRKAQVDGVDRLSSYFRLPEYGVTVVIGPSVDERMAPVRQQQRQMLGVAAAATLLLLGIAWQLLHSIRQREATRAALTEKEERLSLATRHNGIGIFDWNIQTNLLVWDDSMFALYQLDKAGFKGTDASWRNALHPDDLDRTMAELKAAVAGTNPFDTEFRVVWPGGEVRHIKATARVFRAPDGTPLRMLGTNIDVTVRKLGEDQLRLAASVFRSVREGIAITDAAGKIIEINEAFTDLTGYAPGDALGQTLTFFRSGRQPEEFFDTMWSELRQRGQWRGEIWSRRKTGESYAITMTASEVRDSNGNVRNYVGVCSDITPHKNLQRDLERRANHDALTNLPNRVLLMDRLNQALADAQRDKKLVAVVFLDLDGFKAVNDLHGHDVGDELLISLAQRMKAELREGDTLARIGGDEFVAVLPAIEGKEDCHAAMDRLLAAAAQPTEIQGHAIRVTASIGVCVYPLHSRNAEHLLTMADEAMYRAKKTGSNRIQYCELA